MDSKPTILVVDNELSARSELVDVISRHGFNVVTAEGGRAGILKAKEVKPDLILSDVRLPAEDGFEMRREMSADPNLAAIPFILLTPTRSGEGVIDVDSNDADDSLSGPIASEDLISHIESLLYHGRKANPESVVGMDQAEMEEFRREVSENYRHELRSPLDSVVMSLEMAVSHKFEDPAAQTGFLKAVLSDHDRLEALIEDMLLLSDIDQNGLSRGREAVDVEHDITDPIQKCLGRYEGKHLDYVQHVQLDGPLMGPSREISQALLRLADNAFRFCPIRGKVEVWITSSSNGSARILVQDDGPGVETGLREKVFEHYFQTSGAEGLGVGLTIARAIFSSLGGDVRIVDSASGCRVEAVLPATRAPDGANA